MQKDLVPPPDTNYITKSSSCIKWSVFYIPLSFHIQWQHLYSENIMQKRISHYTLILRPKHRKEKHHKKLSRSYHVIRLLVSSPLRAGLWSYAPCKEQEGVQFIMHQKAAFHATG